MTRAQLADDAIAGASVENHVKLEAAAPANEERMLGGREAGRIATVALLTIIAWIYRSPPSAELAVIGVTGVIIGGWPIFKEAAANACARRMTMELSMSIAIVAAAAIGEFFTALLITVFVLLAEVLENLTVARGRRAIHHSLAALPAMASVRGREGIAELPVDQLRPGDLILINPGGAVPVDGVVVSGHSFVDQSPITGEAMPVEKLPGAKAYAGSVNQAGAFEVRVEWVGRATSYGKIIEAVEHAERSRAPVQQIADRLAGYLVYFALGAAGLTFLLTRDVRATIAVVIVAGACGIAAGTPLAILGGIGRCARLGAIVKGGLYLETLGRVDTVVLDKTGTLTVGRPAVQAITPYAAVSPEQLLALAAAAELRSEHPLGKAIVAYAATRQLIIQEPSAFAYTPGLGVRATIDEATLLVGNRALLRNDSIAMPAESQRDCDPGSVVFVAREGVLLGVITLADALRDEARSAVAALHRMGLRTILLTGDTAATATAVAGELAIGEVEAEVLPEAKLARIRELAAGGAIVAMVGDGINDAPALMQASAGVAMGSGTDVARESADVVLLGNDLLKFTEALAIARWTRRIILQNFAGTLGVDAIGIGLAAAGLLHPALAAFIHVASEMIFILNSARLLPVSREEGGRAERVYASMPREAKEAA